jgi:hypothetical protein
MILGSLIIPASGEHLTAGADGNRVGLVFGSSDSEETTAAIEPLCWNAADARVDELAMDWTTAHKISRTVWCLFLYPGSLLTARIVRLHC